MTEAEKEVAKDILSMIKEIYFSDEYFRFRINQGSYGVRNLIISNIENKYINDKGED